MSENQGTENSKNKSMTSPNVGSSGSEGANKTNIKQEKKPDTKGSTTGGKKPWWNNHNRKGKSGDSRQNGDTKVHQGSAFKGTITDMNGHTFQCHGEASHASQFARTCEELQGYCLKQYKYGDDVAFIVRNLKEFDMDNEKPEAAPDGASEIDIRIVDKEVDEFV
jgi:hypothetical protein